MYDEFKKALDSAGSILIIQAENPDGDSLGSALALEEILGDAGKKTHLFCAIDIPKYLRYLEGWSRVTNEWPRSFDLAIIVDTASAALLEKTFVPEQLASLEKNPVAVLDHHATTGTLPFDSINILDEKAVATCELVYEIAKSLKYKINTNAAEYLCAGILSDSLGLTTANTTASSIRVLSELVEIGVSLSELELRRRELMKKSAEILAYKGELLQRVDYHLDGQLATVHIPWEEIEQYSDQYNPSVLVLDEMRLVEGVKLAVAFKTYPDGKITGKLRANPEAPIAEKVAGFFGGGGHLYSAGFKIYEDNFDAVKNEFIGAADKTLKEIEHDKTV